MRFAGDAFNNIKKTGRIDPFLGLRCEDRPDDTGLVVM